MKKIFNAMLLLATLSTSFTVIAQTKVVVIPMAGDDLKPLANIITVAKQNGDFDNPLDAINSISGASSGNRYLVVVAPGSYTLTGPLEIPEYVHLAGSGRNQTSMTISGGSNLLDESAALIKLSNQSQLSSLEVRIISTNAHAIAVYAMQSSSSLNPTSVSDLSIRLQSSGSLSTVGIYDDESNMSINNVSIRLASTSATNKSYIGLQINESSTQVDNLTVAVGTTTGGAMTGVVVESLGFGDIPTISNSNIRATQNGGGSVSGVINLSTTRLMILQSSQVLANATSSPEIAVDGELAIINSLIRGPLGPNSNGNTRCVASSSLSTSSGPSVSSLQALDINCS